MSATRITHSKANLTDIVLIVPASTLLEKLVATDALVPHSAIPLSAKDLDRFQKRITAKLKNAEMKHDSKKLKDARRAERKTAKEMAETQSLNGTVRMIIDVSAASPSSIQPAVKEKGEANSVSRAAKRECDSSKLHGQSVKKGKASRRGELQGGSLGEE